MNRNLLWKLIDEARSRERYLDGQVLFLEEAIGQVSGPEMTEVYRAFMDAHRRAFNDELWAAFDLATGYTGDDSFTDARTWLILQGQTTFDRVLANPDELATTNLDDIEELGLAEQLAATLIEHAEQLVTQGDTTAELQVPEDLTDLPGFPLSRDLAVLRDRFPRSCRHTARSSSVAGSPLEEPCRTRAYSATNVPSVAAPAQDPPSTPAPAPLPPEPCAVCP